MTAASNDYVSMFGIVFFVFVVLLALYAITMTKEPERIELENKSLMFPQITKKEFDAVTAKKQLDAIRKNKRTTTPTPGSGFSQPSRPSGITGTSGGYTGRGTDFSIDVDYGSSDTGSDFSSGGDD